MKIMPARSVSPSYLVSNGRRGADGVVDYDDNKGIGLRLKLTYANPNVEVFPGGYGYYGEVTDKWFAPLDERVLENCDEYAMAGDFLVSVFGLRLQAEYIRYEFRSSVVCFSKKVIIAGSKCRTLF